MVLGRNNRSGRGVHEPAETNAPVGALSSGQVTKESDAEGSLAQRLTQFCDDFGGGIGEPVKDAEHPGIDVIAPGFTGRWLVASESEQVVAFLPAEVETLGDRGDHLLRRLRSPLAFDAHVVVRRHVAQRRDLLAPEASGAATLPAR